MTPWRHRLKTVRRHVATAGRRLRIIESTVCVNERGAGRFVETSGCGDAATAAIRLRAARPGHGAPSADLRFPPKPGLSGQAARLARRLMRPKLHVTVRRWPWPQLRSPHPRASRCRNIVSACDRKVCARSIVPLRRLFFGPALWRAATFWCVADWEGPSRHRPSGRRARRSTNDDFVFLRCVQFIGGI